MCWAIAYPWSDSRVSVCRISISRLPGGSSPREGAGVIVCPATCRRTRYISLEPGRQESSFVLDSGVGLASAGIQASSRRTRKALTTDRTDQTDWTDLFRARTDFISPAHCLLNCVAETICSDPFNPSDPFS